MVHRHHYQDRNQLYKMNKLLKWDHKLHSSLIHMLHILSLLDSNLLHMLYNLMLLNRYYNLALYLNILHKQFPKDNNLKNKQNNLQTLDHMMYNVCSYMSHIQNPLDRNSLYMLNTCSMLLSMFHSLFSHHILYISMDFPGMIHFYIQYKLMLLYIMYNLLLTMNKMDKRYLKDSNQKNSLNMFLLLNYKHCILCLYTKNKKLHLDSNWLHTWYI